MRTRNVTALSQKRYLQSPERLLSLLVGRKECDTPGSDHNPRRSVSVCIHNSVSAIINEMASLMNSGLAV